MEPRTIELDDKKVVIRKYKVRRTGSRGRTLETSIPREAFEREARRLGFLQRRLLIPSTPCGDTTILPVYT